MDNSGMGQGTDGRSSIEVEDADYKLRKLSQETMGMLKEETTCMQIPSPLLPSWPGDMIVGVQGGDWEWNISTLVRILQEALDARTRIQGLLEENSRLQLQNQQWREEVRGMRVQVEGTCCQYLSQVDDLKAAKSEAKRSYAQVADMRAQLEKAQADLRQMASLY